LACVNPCAILFTVISSTMEIDVNKLKRLRINQGLTQRELAKQAGISNTSLWKIEHGGGATAPTLKKLGDVLGIEPAELLKD